MTRQAVSIKFGWGEGTYDYWCDEPVKPGDKVIVETKRGEAKVTVVEVKQGSDKATKSVLRRVEEDK